MSTELRSQNPNAKGSACEKALCLRSLFNISYLSYTIELYWQQNAAHETMYQAPIKNLPF